MAEPTLTVFDAAVASGNEDSEITVSFLDLQNHGNEVDLDGSVTAFVIKAVSSGTLKIGTSAATATAWAAGTNDIIDATHHAYWIPDTDASGVLNAFTVVAKDDGGAESTTPVQATVTVAEVNDAPSASNLNQTISYSEDTQAAIGNIVITDPDADTFTATVTMAGNGSAIGSLTADSGNGETFTPATGVWTITGTKDNVNAALAAMTFVPDANVFGNTSATVSISDGIAPALTGTLTFNGTAVNDVPTLTSFATTVASGNEDSEITVSFADLQIAGDEADVDGTVDSSFVIKAVSSGTLKIGATEDTAEPWAVGINDVVDTDYNAYWTPDANANGILNAFTVVAKDDGGAESISAIQATVSVTAINDVPSVSNLNQTIAYTEDTPAAIGDIVITDPDADSFTATVTMAGGGSAKGSLTASSGNGETYTLATGIWTVTGTKAAVNTALAALTFVPDANVFANTSATVSISDGTAPALTGILTFNGSSVNDAPSVTNLNQTISYTEDTPAAIGGIVITDPDADTFTATVTMAGGGSAIGSLTSSNGGTYTPGTGVWTVTGTKAAVNTALAALTFVPDANVSANTSAVVSISDGIAAPLTGTLTFNGTAVNDAPSASNLNQTISYTEDTPAAIGDIVITDPDSNTVTATVTMAGGGSAIGSLTAGSGKGETYTPATGVWTITGTKDNVNTALAALTFVPDANVSGNTSATVSISDGIAAPLTGTLTFNGTAVNDAPSASNLNQTISYTEDTPAAIGDIVITDPDSNTVTATVTMAGGGSAIGSLTAGSGKGETYTPATGVWTITGTKDNVNTALAALTFVPVANSFADTSATVSISDGIAAPLTGTLTFNGTAVNDSPSASNLNQTISYTEDTPAAIGDIVITDPDSNTVTATVTMTGGGSAKGSLTAGSGKGETYTPATGVWTVTGTKDNVNTALAALTFVPAANSFADTSATVSISDGTAPALTGTLTFNGSPVNDAPSASNLNQTISYTEDTPAAIGDIVITDPDADTFTATVTMAGSGSAKGSLTASSGKGETYSPATGVWTVTGTKAAVNAALAALTFVPDTNVSANTSATVSISDGIAPALTGTLTFNGTAVNDAPSASNLNQTIAYTEDTPAAIGDIVVTDPDSGSVTATVTMAGGGSAIGSLTASSGNGETYSPATGVWTVTGTQAVVNTALAALTFVPDANVSANTSATVSISDGIAAPLTGTLTFNGTAVNDAPSASNLNQTISYTEDTPAAIGGIVITDPDADTFTATVTMAGGDSAIGSLTSSNGGTYTPGTGVWTVTGTKAAVNTALAALMFVPDANVSANTSAIVSISDGTAAPLSGTLTFNGSAVNDAPSASNLNQTIAYTEDTPAAIGDIVITDPDSNIVTATVTMTGNGSAIGSLTAASGKGETFTPETGVWTITGTKDNVNAALAAMTFIPDANVSGNTSATVSISDGIAAPITGTLTFNGTAVNDAPSATFLNQTISYTEDTPAAIGDIVITDPDSNIVTATVTMAGGSSANGSLISSNGGTYTPATGVWTVTGTKSVVNTALASLTFVPVANSFADTSATVSISDGIAAPLTGTLTFNGTAVNDAPSASNLNQTISYIEDTPAAIGDIVITDLDSSTVTATVTMAGGGSAKGSLTASSGNGETYTPATGVWTITGAKAAVNTALAAMTFVPNANVSGNTSATVSISDGIAADLTGILTFNGTAVNDAPTLTTFAAAVASGNEDSEITVIFANLLAQGDENDIDSTVNGFVIKAVSTGSLKIGATAASATAWNAATNSTVSEGLNAYWTPDADNNETLNAFTVVAKDDAGAQSATAIQAKVTVTAVNDAPVATSLTQTITYTEDVTALIDNIVITDPDADTFTATVIMEGGNSNIGTLTASSGHGESFNPATGVWTITGTKDNVNAALAAMSFVPVANGSAGTSATVYISDGSALAPLTGTLTFNGTAVNDVPTLTAFGSAVASGNEDKQITVTSANLQAQGNVGDVEDGTVDSFIIKSVSSGALKIGTTAASASPWAAGSNDLVDATHQAYWTPVANANGLIDAFMLVAKDNDGAESVSAIQAKVAVTPVNDAPTLTAFSGPVASGNENSEITVTFANLQDQGNEADIDGEVTAFVIKAVNTGVLKIGATAETATPWAVGTNDVVDTDYNVYWIPDANASGTLNAFTVKAKDSGNQSATAIQATVFVTAAISPISIVPTGTGNSVTEGGVTDTYSIVLTSAPADNVTINLDTTNNQVTSDVNTLTFTGANWDIPQTVTVTAVNDTVGEGRHTGVIQHTAASTDNRYNGISVSVTVGITDNDLPLAEPAFKLPVVNAFGITGAGNNATPSFADIDGDGDLDAFMGNRDGNILFYRNTGTPSSPAFAAPETNSFGLANVGALASIAFADIDGDGDLDAFAGNDSGNILFFRNTGTASSPAFLATGTNPFGLAKVGSVARPTFADIDGDGDLDAFVGNSDGDILYYLNTGTVRSPVFAAQDTNPFGLTRPKNSVYASPTFADIDGDGDLDAFVANFDGEKWFYRNTGTASSPAFAAPVKNKFGLADVGYFASPTFADIDGDGDLDAFVGEDSGTVRFYRSNVNEAPTLTTFSAPVTTGNEDSQITVTFANLQDQGNDADVDGTVTAFVIKAVSTGTLKIGASAATAKAWAVGANDIVDATHQVYWTPVADANGALNAFTAVAKDNKGAESATAIQAKVTVTPVNDKPALTAPTGINYTDTIFDDTFATVKRSFAASDIDGNTLTYGIKDGKDNGLTMSKSSTYGVLTVTKATGNYSFVANDAAIEALTVAKSASFTVTVSDGSLTSSKTLTIKIAQNGTTESNGNDTLTGTPGNDKLNGLAGADIMAGGLGNDIYTVDNTGDKVTETSTPVTVTSLQVTDIDRVNSSITYTLTANVENLTLIGTAAINGTGNILNNVLTGNTAANILNGGAGVDKLQGGAGNDVYTVDNTGDVVTETSTLATEIDRVNSSVNYTLTANVENLTLTGTAAINGTGNTLKNVLTGNAGANKLSGLEGNDSLNGGAGNDTLNGGGGADTLNGGAGNDVYFVDNAGDKVTETSVLATEIDKVNSSITYTLTANVENLTLTGTAAINGTGNTLNNVLTGNAGVNILNGGAGADKLQGGLGNDILTGGAGKDIFQLTNLSKDTIKDFVVADDTIQLENSVFAKLTVATALNTANFKLGTAAADANDYVIYNSVSGALLYDADGSGAGAATQIAVLGVNLHLTNADFAVI